MRDTRDFLIRGGDLSLSENLQDSEVAAVHIESAPVSVEIFFFLVVVMMIFICFNTVIVL